MKIICLEKQSFVVAKWRHFQLIPLNTASYRSFVFHASAILVANSLECISQSDNLHRSGDKFKGKKKLKSFQPAKNGLVCYTFTYTQNSFIINQPKSKYLN